ncbi:hypothetical protein NFI96_009100, partial [Prochilodus magdalenae]
MEVNSVNSSLTITAVQDSDSGLYYCSSLENKYMIYSTTTYLHIREKFPASSNEPDGDDRWSDGFFILALLGGAVIVVLLSVLLVLLFTVLKYRRQHREDSELKHENKYLYTAVTPGTRSPEFTVVGLVDGEQFEYYDSNIRKLIPRNEWIRKIDADDPEFWKRETQISQANQEIFKDNMGTLIRRLNQTEGVHTWQLMYGCEMDDDGAVRGNRQYSYDGEDYISLDLNTVTYTAAHQKAVLTKHKWDSTRQAKFQTAYLLNECISWLKKYVGYGRSTLERKVLPEVSLFQKDSSPVVCHATGFYPKAVMISWQKNGEDLFEDVELRETLPNQDGTFQRRSILTVPPEELYKHNYTCIIQHISLEKEMVLQVSERRVLS